MKIIIQIVILLSLCLSIPLSSSQLISNEKYIAGEDGVIRMHVKILGHVSNPGVYLVYDGIDIVTLIALAGGYKDGANLSRIAIYNENGTKEILNFKKILDANNKITLKPHDTIFIEQKLFSKIFQSSNIPSIILSMLNIALTLDRTD